MRQKYIAKCEIEVDEYSDYCVAGDELVIKTKDREYKRIYMPFSQKARDGDFIFYSALNDSILQNPFTSVDDVMP